MSSVAMFKIRHNALRYFTFAEVLLMVAINQVEAKRKSNPAERNRRQGID
jgi:hypothetical protein